MKALPAILLLSLLGACATAGNTRYPSLAPRAIESRSDAEPEAVTPGPVAADPALDRQIAGFGKTIDDNDAAFAAASARAGGAAGAARGAAAGTERWIAAQTALAELDGLRATTSSTLTDIETLAIARAADGLPDYPGLAGVHTKAETSLATQTQRIAALQAMLPGT